MDSIIIEFSPRKRIWFKKIEESSIIKKIKELTPEWLEVKIERNDTIKYMARTTQEVKPDEFYSFCDRIEKEIERYSNEILRDTLYTHKIEW